jgi:hypothetical protein
MGGAAPKGGGMARSKNRFESFTTEDAEDTEKKQKTNHENTNGRNHEKDKKRIVPNRYSMVLAEGLGLLPLFQFYVLGKGRVGGAREVAFCGKE